MYYHMGVNQRQQIQAEFFVNKFSLNVLPRRDIHIVVLTGKHQPICLVHFKHQLNFWQIIWLEFFAIKRSS